jgi:hypothetical protein
MPTQRLSSRILTHRMGLLTRGWHIACAARHPAAFISTNGRAAALFPASVERPDARASLGEERASGEGKIRHDVEAGLDEIGHDDRGGDPGGRGDPQHLDPKLGVRTPGPSRCDEVANHLSVKAGTKRRIPLHLDLHSMASTRPCRRGEVRAFPCRYCEAGALSGATAPRDQARTVTGARGAGKPRPGLARGRAGDRAMRRGGLAGGRQRAAGRRPRQRRERRGARAASR